MKKAIGILCICVSFIVLIFVGHITATPTPTVPTASVVSHGDFERLFETSTGRLVWIGLAEPFGTPGVFAVINRERNKGEYEFSIVNTADGTVETRGRIDLPIAYADPLSLRKGSGGHWELVTTGWRAVTDDNGWSWN